MWKDLYLYNERTIYEVSHNGEIRNRKTKKKLKPVIDHCGYCRVCLHINENGEHKQKNLMVHRLIAITFLPNDDPEHKMQVDHLNGNKLDCSIYNLEWVTPKENVIRAHKLGLRKPLKGKDHPSVKYDESTIRHVCELLQENKLTTVEIGKICGVPRKEVQKIKSGTIWAHISREYMIPDVKELRDYSRYHPFVKKCLIHGMSNKEIAQYKPKDMEKEDWRCLVKYIKKRLKSVIERSTTNSETLDIGFNW